MAASIRHIPPQFARPLLLLVILLFLFPLKDKPPRNAQAIYEHALRLFQQGKLASSQLEAEQGYEEFHASSQVWAEKFRLLDAQDLSGLGMYDKSLRTLAELHFSTNDPDLSLSALYTEAGAFTHQQRFSEADRTLFQAEQLCKSKDYSACGYVERARGVLAVEQGKPEIARDYFINSLSLAQAHNDPFLEASASLNLGLSALQSSHFDEAVDWSDKAYRSALQLGAENIAQIAAGNLGWAYFQLGDSEKALDQFKRAENSAVELGNLRYELKWTSTAGYVYRDSGELTRASEAFRRSLDLAKRIDSKEDIFNALDDLARISFETGKLDDADAYLAQLIPMELADRNHLSASVQVTQGLLAAARHRDKEAESLLSAVKGDATNTTTTRLTAGDHLAQLYESEGKHEAAEQMYKATLATFESAREQLTHENSKLPFLAIATLIYDDYIHYLVGRGRGDEALALADQSRARTLAESLGVAVSKLTAGTAAVNPRQIARKAGATVLFYWLGRQQSYLWAITPSTIAMFPLPAQDVIAPRVERYRKALLDLEDPIRGGNEAAEDGQSLYNLLFAPAARLIRPNVPVVILSDGALTQLNFETLLAPGPSPQPSPSPAPSQDRISVGSHSTATAFHYWIEDVTLISAPSLAMLAAAKPPLQADRKLLLLGNPVTVSEDYPALPLFSLEMKEVQKHFQSAGADIFSGPEANPTTYLNSNPAHYSYIHFVSHAIASRTDPLDSAIILSNPHAGDNGFKLYARDIMQHPINARLVTVSACNTSGTRTYAGEGLVGLSWAFLRAGAGSVIGALWEVSDDSTPRLMDALYQGIEDGKTPAAALRLAKLSLLHSDSFSKPFFWAPFQIYTRQ